ncbi:hypothetical protein INR76_00280 [Marixanthomonas sp. SCSIO 43207]|uniref:glycosyltransferase n=1 Tax=Marixanthomonas sp. SCSIO 43207 TaxID=2779360 RepID=UPI001CA987D8|nr:glycosyltransferase [Marixanthomonas sp. SCSIO 43207]UAB81228.1 hypothetical protein INR76_00280 [Marixanthomonas sp. SCSIO 43207]
MISIVVSSYQKHYFEAFSESVAKTIGTIPYEIIQIWNPGSMGICEAYNRGAEKAKYAYLCFVHEDVLFKTKAWGNLILAHLQNENIGAIGVAGSAYKSEIPSSWSIFKTYNALHILQHYKEKSKRPQIIKQPNNVDLFQVVALDGVFIATRKAIWKQFPFDEKTFTSFHGYDVDFSLAISQKYNLFVVFDILIEHFSQGNANNEWLLESMKISDKWRKVLPATCVNLNSGEEKRLKVEAKRRFEKKLSILNYNWIKKKYFKLKYVR